jgi:exodeoxyribonuclease X
VHHIWPEDVAGLAKFDPQREITRATEDGVTAFVAHNSEFEEQWMGGEIPFICTYKASLRMLEFAPTHSNFGLAYFLMDNGLISIDRALMSPAHRALPDAIVTAHLLRLLMSEGATMDQLLQWSREPRLLPTCPIGKWRGVAWSEIDSDYLEWVLSKDFDDDVKWNVRNELANRSAV